MKYIAITEVITRVPYVEPKVYSQEELLKIINEIKFIPLSFEKHEVQKSYLKVEMSEETFNFVKSVANIIVPIYGEKEYKINDLSFRIYEKEEYERVNGKL